MAARDANPDADKNEIYLVDGSGFIFRAYYAMAYGGKPSMTNADGVPVGAVYIFVNMLIKLLEDYNAPYMAVIFDAARENFRNDIYPEYKANRDDTPEDLIPQFPLIREAVAAFDIPCVELEGYEADDLIAAYTKKALEMGKKVVVVSSDKDLMQLIKPGVRMLEPMKGEFMGLPEVEKKFGVTPDKVVDVQALIGDKIDNVPGVPGIGVKTAAQLLEEFGTLENLLDQAETIKQNKRRELLIEHADAARMSKKLVTLDENAPMPMAIEDMKTHDPEKPELVAFLQKQGFKSTLRRLGQNIKPNPKNSVDKGEHTNEDTFIAPDLPTVSKNEYTLINDAETLQTWINEAYEEGTLCVDTETTGITPAKADLVGIALTSKIGKAAYIPLAHVQDTGDLLGGGADTIPQMDKSKAIALLKPILEDPSVLKVAHNMKYDWQIFAAQGIKITPCDDTMLISYVLDGGEHSHSMDNLSKMYCDHTPITYKEVAGTGKNQVTFDKVAIDTALNYAAEDAEITLRLHKILKPRLAQEKMTSVYELIERPLIQTIARMEMEGIKIDPVVLNNMSTEFAKKLAVLEAEIFTIAGTEFNVASPKQIGQVIFDQMGLQGGKKTKTGDWSTSADILEKLAAEGHEIVQKILDHRQLSKLKSTYTDALQAQVNPKTGRVHTSFAMAHTSTGRLSSSDPNLQNIPIRTEEGRKIREAFIAEKGNVLVSVDYSQVELRLAAEIAGVEALKQAFRDGIDIHTLTASQVFGVPFDDVTPEIRRQAKAVNFGIIYGISGWGLAKQLGCPPGEASEFIRLYLIKFHEIQTFMEARKDEAKKKGYVETLYGRKCFTSGIKDKNGARRAFAERQAINAPLQGTAADIMKIAMSRMNAAIDDAGLNAKMLLQVHDELIFETPEAEAEALLKTVQDTMEAAHLALGQSVTVPLKAEGGIGTSWGQAH